MCARRSSYLTYVRKKGLKKTGGKFDASICQICSSNGMMMYKSLCMNNVFETYGVLNELDWMTLWH